MLGWIKVYDYKGATRRSRWITRVYSPAQLSIAQLFANWMQASYLPKGALGDVFQIRNAKLSPYNQNTAALPNAYGAFAKLYIATEIRREQEDRAPDERQPWTGASKPTGSTGLPWTPSARRSATTSRCRRSQQQGYGTDLDKAADVSRHPVLGQFPTRFVRNSRDREQATRRADQGPSASRS